MEAEEYITWAEIPRDTIPISNELGVDPDSDDEMEFEEDEALSGVETAQILKNGAFHYFNHFSSEICYKNILQKLSRLS